MKDLALIDELYDVVLPYYERLDEAGRQRFFELALMIQRYYVKGKRELFEQTRGSILILLGNLHIFRAIPAINNVMIEASLKMPLRSKSARPPP